MKPTNRKWLRKEQKALTEALEDLARCLADIERALGVPPAALTAKDKRRTVRVRKGADAVMRQIVQLVATHRLESEALDAEAIVAPLQIAAALGALEIGLRRATKRISDQRFLATADAWTAALQFYALLQRRALVDGDVAAGLAPIEEFFAFRHAGTRDGKATKLQIRARARLAHARELAERVGVADVDDGNRRDVAT